MMVNTKVCSKCECTKLVREFSKNKLKHDGLNAWCKQCMKTYCNEYHQNNYDKEISVARSTKMRKQNPCRYRASITLNNHKRNGYIINVSIDEVERLYRNIEICPICGCILTHDLGVGQRQTASSLDRKNNETELRIDNIWIICHKCNAICL